MLLPLLLLLPLPRLLPRLQWLWEWLRRGWLRLQVNQRLWRVVQCLRNEHEQNAQSSRLRCR